MTHPRNSGLKSARQPAGGTADHRAQRDKYASRDLYPIPSGSLSSAPGDNERNSVAGKFVIVFLSLWFLIPCIAAGVMLHFR